MLKTTILLVFISLALAQNIPPCVVQCNAVGSATGCPPRSTCRNVSPDGTNQRLVCICDSPSSASCTSVSNLYCSENSTTPTGCGTRFPNGCPTGTSCVSSSTANDRTCVCTNTGAVLDPNTLTCITPCPSNSIRNENGECQCVSPYVRDTTVNAFRCIIGSGATCETIRCPENFHCEYLANQVPGCVPNPDSRVCGTDFRCPTPFVCVDTANGPVCRCPDRFAGPGCVYRECWALEGTNELGCWSMENGTAVCIATTNDRPFCRCAGNLLPPDCQSPDNACANVDCSSIPNSRCIYGRCICREGYIAVPSTSSNTYTCREVGTCNCTGNTVCDSTTGRCVCPADQFGGADCSRPACSTNQDCTDAGLVNSYCVISTNTGVRGFCLCRPGYSGDRCNVQDNSCDSTRCRSPNMVCNNEGRCVCAPGYNGTNCTRPVPPNCITISIVMRRAVASGLTAEQLRAILAAFIGVDQALIEVTGPIVVTRNESVVVFIIKICRDSNTNEQSASDQFVEDVNRGEASSLGIESASLGEYVEETSSSNNSPALYLSIALLFIAAMFA